MYFESNDRPLPGWARYIAMASNERVYVFNTKPELKRADGQTIWHNCASHQSAVNTPRMMDVTHLLAACELKAFRRLSPRRTLTVICPYDEDMTTAIQLAGLADEHEADPCAH